MSSARERDDAGYTCIPYHITVTSQSHCSTLLHTVSYHGDLSESLQISMSHSPVSFLGERKTRLPVYRGCRLSQFETNGA